MTMQISVSAFVKTIYYLHKLFESHIENSIEGLRKVNKTLIMKIYITPNKLIQHPVALWNLNKSTRNQENKPRTSFIK